MEGRQERSLQGKNLTKGSDLVPPGRVKGMKNDFKVALRGCWGIVVLFDTSDSANPGFILLTAPEWASYRGRGNAAESLHGDCAQERSR